MHYIHADDAGIRRVHRGKGFAYERKGRRVRDAATLRRIRALAIPPAWTDVWITSDPEGHVQATGRDAKGRKQYRYHPKWRVVRDEAKYERLVEFCRVLPRLRRAVDRDLAAPVLSKRRVVAGVVALVERAQLRVGNDEYAKHNHSYGATTLRDRHVRVHGDTLELAFRGKSGIEQRTKVTDRRLARIVRRLHELPGQRLFQYVDDDGAMHAITSTDVNDYIHEVTGGPFTAKDYRTWAGTLGAALLLAAIAHPPTQAACKRCIKHVIDEVAHTLGHTAAVCKASYIHPRLLADFTAGTLPRLRAGTAVTVDAMRAIEPAIARYLAPRRRRHA
jgi:DNA topoisomerase I